MPTVLATSAIFSVSGPTPAAVADTFTVAGGATVDLDVLANDLNLTNHTIAGLTQPAAGTTSIINNSTGSAKVRFAATNPASSTVYTFQYSVDGSALATVSVTVTHTATVVAVAVDDIFGPFAAGSTTDLDVLANDTVTSGTISISTPPGGGATASIVSGKIRFVAPSPSVTTDYTLQYTVDGSAPATVTVTVNGAAVTGNGLQLPAMGYQQISDTVPAGAVWWDPTNGNDGNSGGSKTAAKQSFSAAEGAAGVGKRIILAGGAAGSTTYHRLNSPITPTRSGSGSGSRMELYAEPGRIVVLCRDAEFLPILRGDYGWTTINSSLKIYESNMPAISGLGPTDAVASTNAGGSKWSYGSIEIPNGCCGQPHLMAMPWVSPGSIGATSGRAAPSGYGGPYTTFTSAGKVQIRIQPPTAAHAGTEWPTDGVMGNLIGSNGAWREPAGAPGNYKIRIVRYVSSEGSTSYAGIDFTNNVSWWHIKGINLDLCMTAVIMGNNTGIWMERMTQYAFKNGIQQRGTAHQILTDHCQVLCASTHHLAFQTYKTGGIWSNAIRSAPFFAASYVSGSSDYTWNDCLFFGWFDFCYLATSGGSPPFNHKFNYCAMLLTQDDGWSQDGLTGPSELELNHCFVFGGPMLSGGNSGAGPRSGTNEIYVHDCIWDQRIPELWRSYAEGIALPSDWDGIYGICPNGFGAHFQDGWRAYKLYNNTFITCGFTEKGLGWGIAIAPKGDGTNVSSEWQHEVFNNIFMITGSRPYKQPHTTGSGKGDWILNRISCRQSAAGTHRYDYNIYCRSVPWTPVSPELLNVQDSQGTNVASYSNLAAFKGSGHYSTSASMYSDGTQGHEQHGAEQNPSFVNINGLDYRPRGSSSRTAGKSLSGTGWPGARNLAYRGAIDPNGDGSDCGPRP